MESSVKYVLKVEKGELRVHVFVKMILKRNFAKFFMLQSLTKLIISVLTKSYTLLYLPL